jgi:hypothetical protein
MNTYQIDTQVELKTTFTGLDGVTPIDPTTVTLYVQTPDGAVTSYTDVTRLEVGVYVRDVITTQFGPWIYKWRGEGNCDVTSPDTYFQVARSAML